MEYDSDIDDIEVDDDSREYEIPNKRYEILTTDEIVKQMESAITETTSVIPKIPATTVRILLSHLKWDIPQLLEKLTNSNCDAFYKTANVLNPSKAIKKKKVTRTKIECAICFTKFSTSSMVDLGCGHSFCKEDCWPQYLEQKIIGEGACESITCPASDCGIIVDDGTVMKLVKDKEAKIKYQHLMTSSYVEHNRSLRWCPAPGCSNAIKANELMVYRSSCLCSCGFEFCFNCGDEGHDPVPCDLMSKWKKNGNEETITYITKYAKECPQCKSLISKNGGCNHMTCKCRYEFCWLCSGKWQNHKSCNTYRFNEADTNESNFFSHNRLKHYYERYMAHKRSLALEKEVAVTNANEKINELIKSSKLSWADLIFIKTSAQILIDCRKQLMVSYIFAFYSKKCNQKHIFEINQSDLEAAVEKLSLYLEQSIGDEVDANEIKSKIINRSDYCDKRRKQMQDHIYEGYNMDWWTFEN